MGKNRDDEKSVSRRFTVKELKEIAKEIQDLETKKQEKYYEKMSKKAVSEVLKDIKRCKKTFIKEQVKELVNDDTLPEKDELEPLDAHNPLSVCFNLDKDTFDEILEKYNKIRCILYS